MSGRSYAWWSGRLAAVIETLLADPNDELLRLRARRIAEEFRDECNGRAARIREPEIAPQSIRAELAEIAAHPERFMEQFFERADSDVVRRIEEAAGGPHDTGTTPLQNRETGGRA